MTLSGKGDPKKRRENAKDYRRDVDARRPWVFPLLVAVAVAVVGAVVVYAIVSGSAS